MADETFYAVDLPPMIVPGRMILAFWIEFHNFLFRSIISPYSISLAGS